MRERVREPVEPHQEPSGVTRMTSILISVNLCDRGGAYRIICGVGSASQILHPKQHSPMLNFWEKGSDDR